MILTTRSKEGKIFLVTFVDANLMVTTVYVRQHNLERDIKDSNIFHAIDTVRTKTIESKIDTSYS